MTVTNADDGGDGQSRPALFVYNQTLAAGATSAPRRLRFNNPANRLFTFDAVVTALVRTGTVPVSGSQPADGDDQFTTATDTYAGTLVAGSGGLKLFNGVDYVDVPFVARENSYRVRGVLRVTSPSGGVPTVGQVFSPGTMPDLDLELLDSADNRVGLSNNFGSGEEINAVLVPGETYRYRVVGFVTGPVDFSLASTQYMRGGSAESAAGSTFMSPTGGTVAFVPLRFTVNPLAGTVAVRLL